MASTDPFADSSAIRQGSNGTASPALVLSDNGQLPDDFLRLAPSSEAPATGASSASAGYNQNSVAQQQAQLPSARSGAHSLEQIAADEQLARALQAAEVSAPPHVTQQNYAYPQPVPTTYVQKLRVTVYQAKLQKNYGLLRMDPYCKIRVGNTTYATATAESGGKNPTWNRTIQCNFHPGIDSIYLELYDEGTFADDERIAWAHIQLPEQALRGNRVIDWYPLSGKQGDGKEGVVQIATQLEYIPAVVPTVYYAPPVAGGYYVNPGGVPVVGVPYGYPVASQYSAPPRPGPLLTAQATPPTVPLQQAQTVYTIKEDDVVQLKEMFTNIEVSLIRNVLQSARGNKEEAINSLLQLAADATPVQAQVQAAQLNN